MADSDWRAKIPGAAFWLGLLALCLMGLSRDLWTPDEPREAEMAREMFMSPGVIPALAGKPFYEKPPLYYWTAACAYALTGGPSAWSARLISGLSGFLTLLAVFLWGKRAHSKELGVAAAALLALSTVVRAATPASSPRFLNWSRAPVTPALPDREKPPP